MELPPIFAFEDLIAWLNAVVNSCAPGEGTALLRRLGRRLGVTVGHLRNVLKGRRDLSPDALPALLEVIPLEGREAEYLRRLLVKHTAGRADQPAARAAVWEMTKGEHTREPRDLGTLLGRRGGEPGVRAALSAALATLGAEAPGPDVLARQAIVPVTADQIRAALALPPEVDRIGPGLVALRDPATTLRAAEATSGALSWTRDALLRTRSDERRDWFWVGSGDAATERALILATRRLRERLQRLARRGATSPADRLHLIVLPRITLSETLAAPPALWDSEFSRAYLRDRREAAKNLLRMRELADHPSAFLYGNLTLPEILGAWRARRPAHLRSVRAMAQRIKRVNASYIADLLYDRKRFTLAHVDLMAELFGVAGDPDAVLWLEGVARLGEDRPHAERLRVLQTLRGLAAQNGVYLPELESAMMSAGWPVHATYALSVLPGFRPVPAWVSRALRGRVSLEEADEALRILGRLEMLSETGQRTDQSPATWRLKSEAITSAALFQAHDQLLGLADAELDMLGPEHDYTLWMLALPAALWRRLVEILEGFRDEVIAALQDSDARGGADRVLLQLAHCVPVLDLPSRGPLRV